MKLFVIVSAFLVVGKADVAPVALPLAAPVLAAAIQHSSQYHSQDAIGQYAYGYSNDLAAKNEVRSADGQTVGSYSYVDSEGKLQNVQYRSDALHGFRVSATNLPVAPSPAEIVPLPLPEPVKDTPEVVAARSRHLEALKHAEDLAKKTIEAVEATKAAQAHPAIISAATPAALVRSPSFAYSFGINYNNGLYAINSYSLAPQPFLSAYSAPQAFVVAPAVLAEEIAAEADKKQPEVIAARAKVEKEEKKE